MKTVVMFQGGGALGAFGCGAWQRLSRWLDRQGHRVVALAGGSIGAVNAAVIARHAGDAEAGCAALETLWRDRIATPAFPFFGWCPGDGPWPRRLRSWNGLLSGLLVGNRAMYVPQFAAWNPWAGLRRLEHPLFDRRRMHALFEELLPGYDSEAGDGSPLLAVTATELMRGELVLFDSDAGTVGPPHLLASTAIPLMFEPVRIGDGLYWDGEMVRHTPMAMLAARVRASGRAGADEPLQFITIEQLPRRLEPPPLSGVEIAYRLANLLQSDKLHPAELGASTGPGRSLRIRRTPPEHDAISGQFDYSCERIGELIAEGEAAADEALAAAACTLPLASPSRPRLAPAAA